MNRAPVPGLADYLQRVWELGKASIRPALPALAFLYFYRVGVGAYLAVANRTPVLSGSMADLMPRLAVIASVLPLFLLIYTPMLPLQDSLLQGRPISFLEAVRRMLENAWNLALSGIVQAVAFCVPIFVVAIGVAIVAPSLASTPVSLGGVPLGTSSQLDPTRLVLVFAAAMLGMIGMLVVGMLLVFATPAVVLDNEGPLRSITTSVRLVVGRAGVVVARLVAFFFLSFVGLLVLTMPTQILDQVAEITRGPSLGMKIASIVWSAAVGTAFFPFGVASLTVLYRMLVPAPAGVRATPVVLDEEYHPASAANAPFE